MKTSHSLPSEFPCQFEVWDKETKQLRKCGKKPRITIDIDDSGAKVGFCSEHYVDAIMQLESENIAIPSEVLKLIIKKE